MYLKKRSLGLAAGTAVGTLLMALTAKDPASCGGPGGEGIATALGCDPILGTLMLGIFWAAATAFALWVLAPLLRAFGYLRPSVYVVASSGLLVAAMFNLFGWSAIGFDEILGLAKLAAIAAWAAAASWYASSPTREPRKSEAEAETSRVDLD